MDQLSINLRKLLNAVNLSENELARRTGIPQQIINRMLRGENKNPKLNTLQPLAKYFGISISELIGEKLDSTTRVLSVQHQGWETIPLIQWHEIKSFSLENRQAAFYKETTLTDIPVNIHCFAVKMMDDSMSLKFEKGSLLIFDGTKKPSHQDFALFYTSLDQQVFFRQFFYKNDQTYVKCLNPQLKCYKMTMIKDEIYYLGTLIQSRLNHCG